MKYRHYLWHGEREASGFARHGLSRRILEADRLAYGSLWEPQARLDNERRQERSVEPRYSVHREQKRRQRVQPKPRLSGDRRFYHPELGYFGASRTGAQARVEAHPVKSKFVYQQISALPCVRRQARREVLLALGKGGGHRVPHRLSPISEFEC